MLPASRAACVPVFIATYLVQRVCSIYLPIGGIGMLACQLPLAAATVTAAGYLTLNRNERSIVSRYVRRFSHGTG